MAPSTDSRSDYYFLHFVVDNKLIWSGIFCRGPHFNPRFWQWWTANHYGMVTVGCVGKGQVLHKTGRHEYDLPLLLPQVYTNRGLVLVLYQDPHPNNRPLSVHRSQRTGRCDLVVFPDLGQDLDTINWKQSQEGNKGKPSSPFKNNSSIIFPQDLKYWTKYKNIHNIADWIIRSSNTEQELFIIRSGCRLSAFLWHAADIYVVTSETSAHWKVWC